MEVNPLFSFLSHFVQQLRVLHRGAMVVGYAVLLGELAVVGQARILPDAGQIGNNRVAGVSMASAAKQKNVPINRYVPCSFFSIHAPL